ncbi:outer membrane protein assembly factor BamB family protein [Haloarchaeobius sp. DT45]|uniref:outer membrane protein assembly factor BamB family protein n=1 Tax=Haloarchaeobius sp. DT45 TaxID=3446116 RepID=UPI003F6AB333
MRPRTLVALLVIVAGLVGVATVGLTGGQGGELTVAWTSDTAVEGGSNHHEPAVAVVDGEPLVFAPVSSTRQFGDCALVALEADSGAERWRDAVPAANCTTHSVADPSVVDHDGDGRRSVLATTTERDLVAYDPLTGAVEDRYPLSAYGYSKPIVANVTGDAANETLVADVRGYVQALDRGGSPVWTVNRSTYVWATPAVDDLDDDGTTEVAIAGRDGILAVYGNDGSAVWHARTGLSVTWMTTGQLDSDPAVELVAGTNQGPVVAFDGRTGEQEWRHDRQLLSAVQAVGTVDGVPAVFATAGDGSLVALDGRDGAVRWESTVETENVNMMPPPVLGDVDGDGDEELVVASKRGTVSVVAPDSGEVLASHGRDVDVLAHPVLADTDDDGRKEIYVIYTDGRVQRLTYSE